MSELLDQTDSWYGDGDEHFVVDEMSDEHLTDLRGWLLRNASRLQTITLLEMHRVVMQLSGEMAIDAIDSAIAELQEQNPYYWMEERPLFQKIDRIINERRGYVYVHILTEARSD